MLTPDVGPSARRARFERTDMSFLLLGTGPDGELSLLSDRAFDSRNDAMAELSRLTADSAFPHWDAEVSVVDLSGATPVLLVRPATAQDADEVVEGEEEPLEVDEAAEALEPEDVEQPTEAEDADATPDSESEPEVEPEVEPEDEVEDEVEPADSEPEPEAEVSLEIEAVLHDLEEEADAGSLKEALRRTASKMESEGIVAPESIGPAVEEPISEDISDSPEESATDAPSAEAPAWPWATATSTSPLDDPGHDDAISLIRAPGDDETMSVSRPVIMGSYRDTPAAPADEAPVASVDDGSDIVSETAPDAAPETVPAAPEATPAAPETHTETVEAFLAEGEAAQAKTAAPGEEPQEAPAAAGMLSDFIDLGEAETAATGEYVAGAVSLGELSCDDCVYVDSCPNKGQRDPSSCGSFQWK